MLLGLIRGAIREVLSLVGLAASIYLAFKFSDPLAKTYVARVFEDPRISYIVTFVLIIVATLFAVTLVNLFFSQLLKASGLSFVNRFFGVVFGLIRGTVICSILVLVIGFVPGITSEKWWQDSSLAPVFKNITKASLKYLPDEVASYFESAKQGIGKAANELGVPNNINTTPASDNTAPATRPDSQQPQSQPPKTTSDSGEAAQTQQILQSIDDSRQDSAKGAEAAPATTPKPELILESYQEQ
ncbi:MAG: hypothetical protein CSA51_04105 [Gammaproteobacteria bacterium]|nr:MAG: hypothetical protein CSA51_04105 [Gammaproteobacteria bacterium]